MALTLVVPRKSDVHRDADETGLRTPLIHLIREYAANAPRSLQKAIGPSQVGTACKRELAFHLSDREPTRDVHDPWPSIVGTAVHAWLADAVTAANAGLPAPIWCTERRVDAGWGLKGSCDLFHIPSGTVLDWKILGDTQYAKYTSGGPSDKYRTQANVYGLGYENAGYRVSRVGIVFMGRAKRLSDMHIWSEPFDKLTALKAVQRLVKLRNIMAAQVGGVPTDPMRIPETPGGDCFFCLAAETEVVTRQGVRPIAELSGGKHELLVPSSNGSGIFESVPVRSFGVQRLHEIRLRRHRATRTVHATAEHRWILDNGSETTTEGLIPGNLLASIRSRTSEVVQDREAVARGFIFGDGTRAQGNRKVGTLAVYGRSPKAGMLDYFPGFVRHKYPTPSGDTTQWLYGINRIWKDLPSIELPASELISWLAGYFAADGSVSVPGQCEISSASRLAVEFVRDIAEIHGIGHGVINTTSRVGFGTEPTDLFSIGLDPRTLPKWFFLLPHHAERASGRRSSKPKPNRGWRVESVTETDRVEEVFCATVPEVAAFGLVDGLLTGNCSFKSTNDGADGYCPGAKKGKK